MFVDALIQTITRAKINGMAGGTGTPGTPGVPAPSTGVSVSLASDNPRTGALVSSSGGTASRVPVLAFNVTAGTSGAATLTDLTFKKEGYIADSAISNAYLLENGKVVAQYNSLSQAMIQFTGMNLGVNAGQTREFVLAIDPASVDTVITLCAEEVCPVFLGHVRRLHWPIPDPATSDSLPRDEVLGRFRGARDAIRTKLEEQWLEK